MTHRRYEGVNPLNVYVREEITPPQQLVDMSHWEEITPSPIAGESEHNMVRVRGRLFRTKEELMYCWRGNIEITSLANAFPYVDLCFTEAGLYTMGWHTWPSSDLHTQEIIEMMESRGDVHYLYQGGKMVESPLLVASFDKPQDMTWREEREDVISLAEAMPRGVHDSQGDLDVTLIMAEADTLQEFCCDHHHILRSPAGKPYIIANHAINGVVNYVGLDEQRLIEVSEGAFITSPQHPNDKVVLNEGIYLVYHPSK